MGQIMHPMQSQPSASVHSLCRSGARHDDQGVWIAIHVDNAHLIAAAYGNDILRQALFNLQCRVADAIKADVDSVATLGTVSSVEALICNPATLFGPGAEQDQCAVWLDDFCETTALTPFETPVGSIHLSLTSRWRASDREGNLASAWDPIDLPTSWIRTDQPDRVQQFRSDMTLAAPLLAQIGRSSSMLCLAWQPVCAAGESSVLYHEALLRTLDRRGELRPLEDAILACERLGLVRYLDRHVVRLVLDNLNRPGIGALGVNISAQSLRIDPWWSRVLGELAQHPEKARRFIVEITETTPIPDMAQATELVAQLRRLGCWVALDDFGSGYASFRHALTLTPDIIKIDGLFLRRAVEGGRLGDAFGHLVGLADGLGDVIVIAEGVQSAEDARIAEEAGASWHQGYHYGGPTLSTTWATQAEATPDATGKAEPTASPAAGTSFVRNLGASFRREFIVADDDPDMVLTEGPAEGRLGRSLLVAIPASLLLWCGIFAAAAAL